MDMNRQRYIDKKIDIYEERRIYMKRDGYMWRDLDGQRDVKRLREKLIEIWMWRNFDRWEKELWKCLGYEKDVGTYKKNFQRYVMILRYEKYQIDKINTLIDKITT